jgi:iron complex outermembrane receptor protein
VTQYIGTNAVISNAATATIKGLELEISAVPTDRLTLSASMSALDSGYSKSKVPFTLLDTITGQSFNMTGRPLPFTPKLALNISGEYRLPVPTLGGDLRFTASYHRQSKVYYDPLAQETEAQPSYSLTDVRVGFRRDGQRWEISGFAQNLFDKAYYSSFLRSNLVGASTGVQGAPRTIGVELRAKF